ncbi:hypothetical protein ACVWW9_001690 [Agrococcus sp. UYP33]
MARAGRASCHRALVSIDEEPTPVLRLQRAAELRAAGASRKPERDATLARVRFGVYADAESLAAASRQTRYLARIEAVDAVREHPVFARESALAIHGVPFGLEPDRVFTTGDLRTAGSKAGVSHSAVELEPLDVTTVGGLRVCSLAHALADVGRRREPRIAVAAIDWSLRAELVTKEQIVDALGRQSRRGRAAAAQAIAFADRAAESVGESYSRVLIHQLGFAPPELQPKVLGRTGRAYWVDMRWRIAGRRPIYGEFDGAQKYGELANRQGKTGAQALAEEKAREDDLRWSGDPMRWIWVDLMRPTRLDRLLTDYGVPRIRRPSLHLLRAA